MAAKGKRIEEKEAEDDDNRSHEQPPEALVHQKFNILFTLEQVFHGELERIESPDVEGGQCCSQRENDKQDERSGIVRRDGEQRDGIDHTKEEVSEC